YLGFVPKPKTKDGGNAKYTLDSDQQDVIKSFREKTEADLKDIKMKEILKGRSTLRDKDGNTVMEWTKTNVAVEEQLSALNAIAEGLKDDLNDFKAIPSSELPKVDKDLLCQYTLTDFHLGMMSWSEETGGNWDLSIAKKTFNRFIKFGMRAGMNAEVAVLANIGDFLHWDGLEAVTPSSKHILDADGRFTKLVRTSIQMIRWAIKNLLKSHQEVVVIMAEGNHDMASSIWLRELLSSFYENEPRVIVDTNPDPYYCIEFGKNVLFYHHSHLKRMNQLDSVLVSKFKEEYGRAEFAYAHTGHLHHQKINETNLMIIEQHRTLAAKDAYASRGGFGSGRDSQVIIYHKDFGELVRSRIPIQLIETALK
ncbi:MAG: hypothetical protein HRU26_07070, partial [Psychroserpens sp.]|nr:hypothetical protein [Psychroserpens sp.]